MVNGPMEADRRRHLLRHPTLRIDLIGTLLDDELVSGYRGIPYGTIEKRWSRATAYSHQSDTAFDACNFGPKCPQPAELNCTKDYGPSIPFPEVPENDLECLNLNVYCPTTPSAASIPVMIWIHGGSLCVGAGSDPIWDPAKLVQESIRLGKPIVAVSINYRLGPFGFLAPQDPHDHTVEQGNFGFHDQYLALQWVQAHIAGFNGDPGRVTIGGESAGGCSVHAQIAFQARGTELLFKRAILQSGTLAVMGFIDKGAMAQLWKKALAEAGIESNDAALEKMRNMSAQQIISNRALQLDGYAVLLDDFFVASPLISKTGLFETHSTGIDAVLHGDNAHEGNFFRLAAQQPDALNELRRTATLLLGSEDCAKLFKIYELSDDLDRQELTWRLHQFPEDVRFYLHSDELQRAWPDSAFYHLSAPSPFGTSAWPKESFHTLDLLYVFGNFDKFLAAEGMAAHLRVGQEMRNAWLNFIWGQEAWQGCFDGSAVTFGIDGMVQRRFEQCRDWPSKRRQRLRDLQMLGVDRVTQVCTVLYP